MYKYAYWVDAVSCKTQIHTHKVCYSHTHLAATCNHTHTHAHAHLSSSPHSFTFIYTLLCIYRDNMHLSLDTCNIAQGKIHKNSKHFSSIPPYTWGILVDSEYPDNPFTLRTANLTDTSRQAKSARSSPESGSVWTKA